MSCGLLLAPICLVTTSENDLFSDIYESIFDWNFVLGFFHFVRMTGLPHTATVPVLSKVTRTVLEYEYKYW